MSTTDVAHWFHPQFGDPLTEPRMYEQNSPHLHVEKITTPVDAKFLYFPDENHWILTPGNAAVWYETVFAFLAEHVLGDPWRRPALL